MKKTFFVVAAAAISLPAVAQAQDAEAEVAAPAPVHPAPRWAVLPVNTLVEITPSEEITSKKMKEGTTRQFLVTRDVVESGTVIIPRGSPITAEVTWRTGKGVVGKSAKFELAFRSVRVLGRDYQLRGQHRQEGRGNTAGALLGATFITGKSATMVPGQLINVFTAEEIRVPAG